MNRTQSWRGALAALALLGAVGCSGDLDVSNPNAPDAKRAFSDPNTIAALAGGSLRTWMVTRQDYNSALLHSAMADGYTASWNNWNMRYYTSYGVECPSRCGWQNVQTSAQYAQIETLYYGYYSALSAVNDALLAIRKNGVIIGSAANTKMLETLGVMMQGMVYAEIANAYDQGFYVDEDTDLSDPLALPLSTREEMRDIAQTHLEEAYQLAVANSFSTPSSWLGEVNGRSYTNTQLAQVIRTLQAEYLAGFPRNAAENGQVNWAKVAQLAAQGVSSGAGFDFEFFVDNGAYYDGIKNWGNDITTVRTDSRMARVITDGPDPSKVHVYPWPVPNGNPMPIAYDKRVGDGTWGPYDDVLGVNTKAATANAGTDYAWAGATIFPLARGTEHFSNLGHIRYSYLAYPGYGLPDEDGTGQDPIITRAENDLLWAEGLIRSGGDKALAAQKINNTRVARGGLTPLTGAESTTDMLRALNYEQLIENQGMGSLHFYNRRRVTPSNYVNGAPCPTEAIYCLGQNTPRHMPIPAKELGVLKKELYSFGGAGGPEQSAGINGSAGVRNVRDIFADMEKATRTMARRRSHQ
jgi:hypothetical protein